VTGPGLARHHLERRCAIKTVNVALAIVGILAASIVVVLLVRVLGSTQELLRLLRTEQPPPLAATEEDAAPAREPPSAPDASLEAGLGRARPSIALESEPSFEDGGAEGAGAAADASIEEGSVEVDAGVPAEAAALVEPPRRIQCGWRMCPEGEVCCNWSCSTCAPPGQMCDYFCGAPSIPISIPCGPNTCNVTEICCNRSCGICVPSGGTCSQEPCPDTIYDPYSAPCGMSTCNVGEVCCNPSCGICTKPGERCSIEPCP
jgi:hypothetical protein